MDENPAEALVAAAYRLWLCDCRPSPDSGSRLDPPGACIIDAIAMVNWPAAIAHARGATGAADCRALVHCMGSMSLLMRLARGTGGVRHGMSSQLTLHPVTSWMNDPKADLNAASLVSGLPMLHGLFDFSGSGTALDKEIDVAAWQLPAPAGQARGNPVCRRIFGVYGPNDDHAPLNHFTHMIVAEMVGTIGLPARPHRQAIRRLGRVVDAAGADTCLTATGARNLAPTITFLSAANNPFFMPETAM